MDSRIFLTLSTLLLFGSGVTCVEEIPTTVVGAAEEANKSQWPEIPANLSDLKSFVESLSGAVTALQTRSRDIGKRVAKIRDQVADMGGGRATKALERMLRDPKATFFKGENMTGEAVSYDSTSIENPGGCRDVGNASIRSMQTSEFCVRVFQDDACSGMSRALYPKPNVSGEFINFISPKLPYVGSVGPCLPNEFQFARVSFRRFTAKVFARKDETNIRSVPDFVDFYGLETYEPNSTNIYSTSHPVYKYYMELGRPKWIWTYIKRSHLQGNGGSTAGRNLAIPPGLGGPRYEGYNIFQQSQRNFDHWKQITDQIQFHVRAEADNDVAVILTFVYESPSVRKPHGFFYWLRFFNGGDKTRVLYGFLEN